MSEHALISPSSAERILACSGSLATSADIPSTTSKYAREGTAAHMLASIALTDRKPASAYVGRMFYPDPEHGVEVTEEMAEYVQTYMDNIAEYAGWATFETSQDFEAPEVSDVYIEQKVDTSLAVGIPGQFGTADVIVLDYAAGELQIHDLKYGKGVRVDAKENTQLLLYAAGALDTYSLIYPFNVVRLVIHQVRLTDAPSEWYVSAVDLKKRIKKMQKGIALAHKLYTQRAEITSWDKYLKPSSRPGQDHCRFCPALPTCPAVEALARKTAIDYFDDLDAPESVRELPVGVTLSECKALTPLLELWCKAINTKVHEELGVGHFVPGYKLVAGKKGRRAWDADNMGVVEQLIEGHYDEDAYTKKLVSPAQAEKLSKKKNITDIWEGLKAFVTQPDGKPQVVPASDPRPALDVTPVEDHFDDLKEEE